MKRCRKCGIDRDETEYYGRDGYNVRGTCKACHRKGQKKYRDSLPWDVSRDRHYRSEFGISLVQYQAMLEEQDDKCNICRRPATDFKKELEVDHRHCDGLVRGLLCSRCNLGVGFFKDDVDLLRSAIEHLKLQSNGGDHTLGGDQENLAA